MEPGAGPSADNPPLPFLLRPSRPGSAKFAGAQAGDTMVVSEPQHPHEDTSHASVYPARKPTLGTDLARLCPGEVQLREVLLLPAERRLRVQAWRRWKAREF